MSARAKVLLVGLFVVVAALAFLWLATPGYCKADGNPFDCDDDMMPSSVS